MPRQLVARPTATPAHAIPQDTDPEALRQASEALRRARAVRQLVDWAKSLLMSQDGLSEQEAFRRLQKTSMNTRTPMIKVAEAVLLADEVRRPDRRP
jgi:AmiR/NasT family two-component response regulator